MTEPSKRATVYFDSELHRALRVKAALTHRSISELVNEAVRRALNGDQTLHLLENYSEARIREFDETNEAPAELLERGRKRIDE